MKETEIFLHENHKRSLTSTLIVVEQLLNDIEELMKKPYNTCCYKIEYDIDDEAVNHNLKIIEESRNLICTLHDKYNTEKRVQSLQRIIDTKKTKIWEILHDSKSRRMKGFGEFPQKFIKDYDKDIDDLMAISEKLTF